MATKKAITITEEEYAELVSLRARSVIDNKVVITLENYMEYQNLLKHRKEVHFIETVNTTSQDNKIFTGESTGWKSDGAAWVKLTSKCRELGDRQNLIYKSNKIFIEMLFKMNWRKFRAMKKQLEADGADQVLHEYLKGYRS